jgi:hypothetical protein
VKRTKAAAAQREAHCSQAGDGTQDAGWQFSRQCTVRVDWVASMRVLFLLSSTCQAERDCTVPRAVP